MPVYNNLRDATISAVMRLVITLVLLTVSVFGQQPKGDTNSEPATGSIHGLILDQAGQPANKVEIAALAICEDPRGCALSRGGAITGSTGEFRFPRLGLGKWIIFADDSDLGYVSFGRDLSPPGIYETAELTAEHPDAEVRISLPPKAGFLDIHLTDKIAGTVIPMVSIRVALAENPDRQLFRMSINQSLCGKAHFGCSFLVPPDTVVLVHVWADGYREWNESASGSGKPLRIHSGDHVNWDIQLDPITH